jgi:adenosylhomocysteine nucleosidase
MEREVHPLVKGWRSSESEYGGRRFRFFEQGEVVLVCGGIGAEAARQAAEVVIALYAATVVYSVGFAGALDPSLRVGDIVEPGRVIDAGDSSSVSLCESRMGAAELRSAGLRLGPCSVDNPHFSRKERARNGAPTELRSAGQPGAAVPTCVLVSFGSVATTEQKAKLREAFAAQAVDMEAAAVGRVAKARGLEFGVVKVISDEFDFTFPPLERFVNFQGRFSEARFACFAALRPWLWPQVARLAGNSRRASCALCRRLQEVVSV